MKLEDSIQEKLQELFIVHSIQRVNYSPHPFMIGANHVKHASDKHGGMLGKATLKAVPCDYPGCKTDYEGHTSDNVLFLSLKKNMSQEEAQQLLTSIEDLMKENSIDGFTFVETPEKFRIQ